MTDLARQGIIPSSGTKGFLFPNSDLSQPISDDPPPLGWQRPPPNPLVKVQWQPPEILPDESEPGRFDIAFGRRIQRPFAWHFFRGMLPAGTGGEVSLELELLPPERALVGFEVDTSATGKSLAFASRARSGWQTLRQVIPYSDSPRVVTLMLSL